MRSNSIGAGATEAVNFTNDFPMVFNSPFRRRGNVRADGKVNVTFTH